MNISKTVLKAARSAFAKSGYAAMKAKTTAAQRQAWRLKGGLANKKRALTKKS